jgi:hypothetical protein
MMYEVRQSRPAKALRDSRKRRGAGQASSLAWDLKSRVSHLLKLSKGLKRADQERRRHGV